MEMLMAKKKIKKLGKKTGDYKPLDQVPSELFLPPGNPINKKKAKNIDFFTKDNTYPV
jgi:hypothetical protein